MMKKLLNRSVLAFAVSSLSLLGFFLLVNPEGKPLPYIFLPVVLIWVMLFSFAQILIKVVFKDTSRMRTVIVFVAVSFIVLLLLLSGIGQLTVSDVVLASVLVMVSTFYFYRTWS
jgi:hypothetical protein